MTHHERPGGGESRPVLALAGEAMKMSARRWTMGAIVCAATSVVGLVLAGGVAEAAVPAPQPRFVEGNVTTCAAAGLSGEIILQGGSGDASSDAGTGDVSGDGLFLDVTINVGWTASGVAVKGGPDTFVYDGPFAGPITVEDMRAPDNPGGQQPEISHWLVCGTRTGPTPTATLTATPSGPPRTGGGGSLTDSGWFAGGAALFAAVALAGALAWRRRNDNA